MDAPAKPSLGSEVYSGVATYGRIRAVIGAVMGVLVALVIIIIGIVKLRDPHTASAHATVQSVASCRQAAPPPGGPPDAPPGAYTCEVAVTFTAGGAAVGPVSLAVTSPAPVKVGDVVLIRYDPAEPKDVVQEASPRALGLGLIGGGIFIGGLAVGIAVLSFKYKGFAAAEGALGLANGLTGRGSFL